MTQALSGLSFGRENHEDLSLPRPPKLELLAIGVLLVASGILILLLGHGLNFRHDDWDIIEYRGTGGASTFLTPLNSQPSLVSVAVYRFLFATAGLGHYFWYRLVLVVFDLILGFFLWLLLRRRLPPVLALSMCGTLVLCGAVYENFIFPIQIGQVGSLIGAVIAWAILDRDPGRSGPVILGLALLFAWACSAIGAVILAAVGIEVLLRRAWGYLVAVVVASGCFVLWYLAYGQGSTAGAPHQLSVFLSGIIAYTVAGTFALWPLFHLSHAGLKAGAALILLVAIVLVVVGSRRKWFGSRPGDCAMHASIPRATGLAVAGAGYWALTSVARADLSPYRSRYIHPGAIVIVLLIAEFLAYRAIPRRTQLYGVFICGLVVLSGTAYLIHNANTYRQQSAILSAQLSALQLARADAPANFEPAPAQDRQIRAALLFRAERTFRSSPAEPVTALTRAPEPARLAADEVLIRISLSQSVRVPCGGDASRTAMSEGYRVPAGTDLVLINLSRPAVRVSLRRFASVPTPLPQLLDGDGRLQLLTERDRWATPWRLYFTPRTNVVACMQGPGP